MSRTINVFDVPTEIAQGEMIVESFGLIENNSSEEIEAAKLSRNDPFMLSMELIKQALREINGKAVSLADGSVETALNKMGAQVRQLVMSAYQDIHSVPEVLNKSFLKTRKRVVR
jgi:predicted outer membrane protein